MPLSKPSEKELKIIAQERPYALMVMQTQMLYDIAGMIEELVEKLESGLAKPRGLTYPIKVLVDGLVIIDFVNGLPHTPLFSITIYNDGPGNVYPSVNEYQKSVSLKPGESLNIDLHAPKIERLYLDVDEGNTATVRGIGLY